MSIKIQFDELQYQQDAVNAAVDLFSGQTPRQSNFTVNVRDAQQNLFRTEHGIGNKLELSYDDVLRNLNEVQHRGGIKPSIELGAAPYPEFEIDMETGTGKTYIYTKTIFELNKRYGFTKFVVVVPSIAIKEGAYKNFQITEDVIRRDYNNESYKYFFYNSGKLDQVRDFVTSDNIEIMIINIQAFNRSFTDSDKETAANIIHRPNEDFMKNKPIDVIANTNPIVIIDEPQSADTTERSKKAITSLNPLCTLRYSATHIKQNNLIYKLDAVDAHQQKLVKQIEVTSFSSDSDVEKPYLKLIDTQSDKTGISATIEIDKKQKNSIRKKIVKVKQGTDIEKISGGRDTYQGFIVTDINHKDKEVTFTGSSEVLSMDNQIGGIPDGELKSKQIEATIRAHLDKELILNDMDIKVLSLFFIDRVANYRYYDEDGRANKGRYALEFEQLYSKIIKEEKYKKTFGTAENPVEYAHDGYFSVDKKTGTRGQFIDTSGQLIDDNDTYELIMRDKERLLSLDTKLRFIFSHSALREGWDNPNVFQICTLNETHSQIKKRQEIGRGLRLCVDQNGERKQGFEINTLTVVANESYDEFVSGLQKEYEEDAGIRFGYLSPEIFSNINISKVNNQIELLAYEKAQELFEFFIEKKYISKDGKILKALERDVERKSVDVPMDLIDIRIEILKRCQKAMLGLQVKNTEKKELVGLNYDKFNCDEFNTLWDKIKYKSAYRANFDTDELVKDILENIDFSLSRNRRKIDQISATVSLGEGGVYSENVHTVRDFESSELELGDLPDIITELQNSTDLKRQTLVEILIKSETLHLFKQNPQRYMQDISKIINSAKQRFIVKGINYSKRSDNDFYPKELFEKHGFYAYIGNNAMRSTRSIYSYVVYDSNEEEKFVLRLEADPRIKVYAKLPSWFKVDTPLGTYNPDWVIVALINGLLKFYVVETKASVDKGDLRGKEHGKIMCAREHFTAIGDAEFIYVAGYDMFMNQL